MEVWDSISLDLISIQVEGKIVYINAAGAQMLGAATPAQLLGEPILDFVHPDYREIAAERVRQITTERIVVCPSSEKWLRLDGEPIDVEVVTMPVVYQGKYAIQVIVRKDTSYKSHMLARNLHSASRPRGRRGT